MAGNSQRRGAVRRSSKGNPTAGSGGRSRRALEGKGPTPKAEDRPYHKKYKMVEAAKKRESGRPKRRSNDGGPEWVAGRNSVVELLRAKVPIASLHIAEGIDRDERIREIFQLAAEQHVSILEAFRSELDVHTSKAVHQGVAAKLNAYEYAAPADLVELAAEKGEPPLIVMLDGITDPRNLGAIVRSASGFGVHGVVIPERRSAQMTAAAWKTSAGAAARVRVARATNLTRTLQAYREQGLMVVGLAADGHVELPELDLADGPLVVVIGSEGRGISRLVAEHCDQMVSIPMSSSLESLNAGVATGIALYSISQARR